MAAVAVGFFFFFLFFFFRTGFREALELSRHCIEKGRASHCGPETSPFVKTRRCHVISTSVMVNLARYADEWSGDVGLELLVPKV